MSFDKHLTQQLQEIIEAGLVRVPIPYEKGNSIRIKNLVIRKHHNGYRLFNLTTNKHICTVFCKTTALAIAKLTVENTPFDMQNIIKLDDKVAKYYMDALYAKRSMKNAENEDTKTTAEIKYDIAVDKAWSCLDQLEKFIFDK